MRMIYQLFMILLLASCTSKKQIKIMPLNPFSKVSTKEGKTTRDVYFLVKNWSFNSDKNYKALNDFSDNFKRSDTALSNLCAINFFKESDLTNENFKELESDLIEWHTKDLIFSKGCQDDSVVYIQRFRNGEVLDTSDVKIIDIRTDN